MRHCFEQRIAESFDRSRKDEERAALVERRELVVGDVADAAYPIRMWKSSQEPLELGLPVGERRFFGGERLYGDWT